MKLINLIGLIGLTGLLAGCPLEVVVPTGGDVRSDSGTLDCTSGNTCFVDVADTTFQETFTAVPRPGYEFAGWEGIANDLCDGPTCEIDLVPRQGIQFWENFVASNTTGELKPIFRARQRIVTGFVGLNGAVPAGYLDTEQSWTANIEQVPVGGYLAVRVTFPEMTVPCSRGIPIPTVSNAFIRPDNTPWPSSGLFMTNAAVVGVGPCGVPGWHFWVQQGNNSNSSPNPNSSFSFYFVDPTYPPEQ